MFDKTSSYWDLDTPDFCPAPASARARYDVAVIGGGYSGLATALFLARQGCSVVVLEGEKIGFGCSSRNGGMVGPSFHKLGMAGLTRAYGTQAAQALMRAGIEALDFFEDFVAQEDLDCDFQLTGRFRGARTDAELTTLLAEAERLAQQVGLPYTAVNAADMHQYIGSNAYCGGVFYPRDGGLHPKKLVTGLAARAQAAGAVLRAHCPVRQIHPEAAGHRIVTPKGDIHAAHVVIATNGYTDRRLPSMNNRIVPIWVTVATTRAFAPEHIRAMSPQLQMHGETGRVFIWSRPTPDGKRFMFGGRLTDRHASPMRQRHDIARRVGRIFPSLTPDDFEHVSFGKIAYTADHAPHLNQIDGIWHIGGYCGSGVTRSIYFAHKLARKITGAADSDLPFDQLTFPQVPVRFLAPQVAKIMTKYYGILDTRDLRRAP
ncbi:hypothetical protein BFP70_10240 [Thioclava sp. SK-1]|uniref:NAD(P)/FAD-dependent oxidoreductase n=1 Tax=Thioclava sp. SK-1 TaxID=1889770 RepID=UPI000826CCD6|nr:FAD-binding oxidoreductase [Thioclava sp. SK-1]OCX65155.1 hypothetical protein BFP70_10240 [Thioclava sp. SK-1]